MILRYVRSSTLALLAVLVVGAVISGGLPGLDGFVHVTRFESNPWLEAMAEDEQPEDMLLFGKTVHGVPTPQQLDAAGLQARRVARMSAASGNSITKKSWKYVGPANIGGRVIEIVVDPKLKNTIYIATASGGIWKSVDAGMTYKPAWPGKNVQAMGALAMGSDGTLWAGTGELNPGGGSLTYGGDGVYKSANRGKSWKRVGLTNSSTIGRIVVNPKDPKHVVVGVGGNLFIPGGERGVYETKDAGKTWKQTLEMPNDTTGVADVQMDPKNPDNIYAATWDHLRAPSARRYSGPGSGVYRTADGGKTWERLGPTHGLPAPADPVGRVGLGLDPQQPEVLYAIYGNNEGTFMSFHKSTDGGDTWLAPPGAQVDLADSQLVYSWWFGRIWVDPTNSNRVFVAGLPLSESVDGGERFAITHGFLHADQHAMAWDPHKKGRVYNGNDGGMYRSDEDGQNGTWKKARYQPWMQFFTIDVSEKDPTRINGGLQDNGSVRSWGGDDWNSYYGGDGVKNAINPKDQDNVFACLQYGDCVYSLNGGNDRSAMTGASDRYGWMTPIEFDLEDPEIVYWGAGDIVHRSTDKGASWSPISPDLGMLDPGTETNPLYAGHYGVVQAIGLNQAEPNTIWAGTDNAHLYRTTDGTLWTEIASDDLPQHWITHIQVHPNNPDIAYVTYSGYRSGDNKAYMFFTKDAGATWTDVTYNLPKAPLNDVILVGKRLFVASDVGVFTKSVTAKKWLRLGKSLPNCPVNDIRYNTKTKTLFAGTFGRGVWKVKV